MYYTALHFYYQSWLIQNVLANGAVAVRTIGAVAGGDRLSGRGTTRVEDARGTPTQSHISPSILVYEEKRYPLLRIGG